MTISRLKIWKLFTILFWTGIAGVVALLLIAAIQRKDNKVCKGVEIRIRETGSPLFIDKNDIRGMLTHMVPQIKGKPLSTFSLKQMEKTLEGNVWIRDAELYFDNNEMLQVKIIERTPVARIFTTSGRSYYIDRELKRLPLSSRFSANIPVFTGCPLDNNQWDISDSSALSQIKAISEWLMNDAFWMAQIEQISCTPAGTFELSPKIGSHVIQLGDGFDLDNKFGKLFSFYKEVLSKVGWDTYSVINIQYKGQVVATRKDIASPVIIAKTNQLSDSIKTR